MSSNEENDYTFHMKDNEITISGNFASMSDTTPLTDYLLVCHYEMNVLNEEKRKFEIEKNVLKEDKQRFEAEKMEFTIEKEVFEKKKKSLRQEIENEVKKDLEFEKYVLNERFESPQHMDVKEKEEEEEEVYEVDLSQTQDHCQTSEAPKQRDLKNKETAQQTTSTITTTNTQTEVIVASTIAFDKSSPLTMTQTNETTIMLERNETKSDSLDSDLNESERQRLIDSMKTKRLSVVLKRLTTEEINSSNACLEDDNRRLHKQRNVEKPIEETIETAAIVASTEAFHKASTSSVTQTTPSHQMTTRRNKDHINDVHPNLKTEYKCEDCGKVYTWRSSFSKHRKTVHGKPTDWGLSVGRPRKESKI